MLSVQPFDPLAQHLVAIEEEIAAKRLAVERLEEPSLVVLPHLVKRNLVQIEPEGNRFSTFGWNANELGCNKNRTKQAEPI